MDLVQKPPPEYARPLVIGLEFPDLYSLAVLVGYLGEAVRTGSMPPLDHPLAAVLRQLYEKGLPEVRLAQVAEAHGIN